MGLGGTVVTSGPSDVPLAVVGPTVDVAVCPLVWVVGGSVVDDALPAGDVAVVPDDVTVVLGEFVGAAVLVDVSLPEMYNIEIMSGRV